ncbi:hypothetical protein COLO4_16952 [Corchorus olitorius]|uniref:Uncharacterized protein n=1 Tax=Corchorus olitorius TaxID=93759 RepID=A0A1R3JEV8_9ROSI|nr:hypothetical protein COLO4_16952 [Corchorus olitorius]
MSQQSNSEDDLARMGSKPPIQSSTLHTCVNLGKVVSAVYFVDP